MITNYTMITTSIYYMTLLTVLLFDTIIIL